MKQNMKQDKEPEALESFLKRKVSRPREKFIVFILFLAASAAVVISAIILYTLIEGTIIFFSFDEGSLKEFFLGDQWIATENDPKLGIIPLLKGTLLITVGAVAIGAPLGIGAALYLSEFARPRTRAAIKPVIEVLAGIPSIVFGFFAYLVIRKIFHEHFGADYFNAWGAIIPIAIMILPIIVSISDDAMKAVPRHLRDASSAMGATKWETSVRIVLPAASSGVIASVLLGVARAIGETMVVVLASGGIANNSLNPFEGIMPMTVAIAKSATGDVPPGPAAEAAFAIGLVLFMITYCVNFVAGRVVIRIKAGETGHRAKKTRLSKIFAKAIEYLRESLAHVSKHRVDRTGPNGKLTSEQFLKIRYVKGRFGTVLTGACLAIAGAFLAYLLYYIFSTGTSAINYQFLTGFPSFFRPSTAGIYPSLMGTIYLMLLTMLFAVPTGVGAAVYLTEIAPNRRSTRFLRSIIQNLAGVPSIVFGLVGYALFVSYFGLRPNLLAGSMTLAFMSLPIIVVATEEALKAVPQSFREAALGMGATRWQVVRHHVIPNAIPGILTGSILALSRAIGETAPLLFLGAAFSKTAPSGVLDPFTALPLTIFYWTTQPEGKGFQELAGATIIVLLLILLSMNAIAIFIRQRASARRDW